MNLAIAAAVFPVIFIGELPDKTMFASLLLASRGHARAVWAGAASAFAVHVVIATTIGVGLFHVVPHRALDALVAVLFAAGGVWALLEGTPDESELVAREVASHRQVFSTAFGVIFIAEWGDLTQVLTANLAAHYRSPVSVAVGAVLALMGGGRHRGRRRPGIAALRAHRDRPESDRGGALRPGRGGGLGCVPLTVGPHPDQFVSGCAAKNFQIVALASICFVVNPRRGIGIEPGQVWPPPSMM